MIIRLLSQRQLAFLSKILFALCLITFCSKESNAQVSTNPENKNFLIEKGTGHVCGSCPSITMRCDTVINSHPGRGILMEYHFGPDAIPQGPPLDADFTTPYGDTIYDPAGLNWPFYLNMMVNRRDQGLPWGSTFIFGATNQVQAEADVVVTQASDVNLAMSSTFNSTTRLLTVHVEVYYTASSATAMNFIQIALTEDSILLTQYDPAYPLNNNFNPDFNHMNTFRANLNGFSGDTVFTTAQGTLVSRTYTYTIPSAYKNISCNPDNCNLTLYVAEEKTASGVQSFTGKIITAIRTRVGGSSTTAVNGIDKEKDEIIYPNPSNGIFYVRKLGTGNYSYEVMDLLGNKIYSTSGFDTQVTKLDLSQFPKGIYLLNVISAKGINTYKISLTN